MRAGPAAVAAAVLAVAACSGGHTQAAARAAPPAARATVKAPLVGVFEPGAPLSYAPLERFAAATEVQPQVAAWYSGWGDPFRTGFARQAAAHGAVPLVQVSPGTEVSMASVADGAQDAYLRSYAAQVRAYGGQVIIGFAAEMNGNWDPWGAGRTPAAQWIAAWRHVVTLFRAQGAVNVTWLWTVNEVGAAAPPVGGWWPGAAYVSMVGIDGYCVRPPDTFASVFGRTLAQVRALTRDPVLLSEVASGPGAGTEREAQITGLFAGVKADGLAGFVWFDQAQDDGPYHQDWRLEDSPAALAAFRAAVKEYGA
jgi:Glycosyl hydrolase family 26